MEQQAINLVANILLVEDDDDLAELVSTSAIICASNKIGVLYLC